MEEQIVSLSSLLHHCRLSESEVDIEVNEKDYMGIARCFTDWRQAAPFCNIKGNEIYDIECDYKTEENQRVGFLTAWKRKSSFKATYLCLIKALLKGDKADEARNVCMFLKDLKGLSGENSDTQLSDSISRKQAHEDTESEQSMNLFQPVKKIKMDEDCTDEQESVAKNRRKGAICDAVHAESNVTKHQVSPSKISSSSAELENAESCSSNDYTKEDVYLLKKKFDELLSEFESSLHENKVTVSNIIKFLKRIPIADRLQLKDSSSNTSEIFKASSIDELLFVLSPCWDFLHLGVLEHLINKFGAEKNKQNLKNYLVFLNDFRNKVSVSRFLNIYDKAPETLSEFYYVKLKTVMDKQWETVTLQEVEELRLKLAMKHFHTTWVEAYPVISSIAICFIIPFGVKLNLKELVPLLLSQGALKIFLNDWCIIDSKIKPWLPDNPTSSLENCPKSLAFLAEEILIQSEKELHECHHTDVALECLSSHLKEQCHLKHETTLAINVQNLNKISDILLLRKSLHIRYLSLAIIRYEYVGPLTSSIQIECEGTNMYTVVNSGTDSWLSASLQDDLNILSEQTKVTAFEEDAVRDIMQCTISFMTPQCLTDNLEKAVLSNFTSIMRVTKWYGHSYSYFNRKFFDRMENESYFFERHLKLNKTSDELFSKSNRRDEAKDIIHFVYHELCWHMRIQPRNIGDIAYIRDNIYDAVCHTRETFKTLLLLLLLLDQLCIKAFISSAINDENYLEFIGMLNEMHCKL